MPAALHRWTRWDKQQMMTDKLHWLLGCSPVVKHLLVISSFLCLNICFSSLICSHMWIYSVLSWLNVTADLSWTLLLSITALYDVSALHFGSEEQIPALCFGTTEAIYSLLIKSQSCVPEKTAVFKIQTRYQLLARWRLQRWTRWDKQHAVDAEQVFFLVMLISKQDGRVHIHSKP